MENKFGAFKGVFIPSILTILGVILFLRLGWVVGQAGLTSTIIIITISSLITFLTALSISAAATNTEVGPGGSYFLISRCFGLEVGAAIGLPLYLAQSLGITFYAVGFAESLSLIFPNISISIVAFATLVILTAVTFISSEIALKTQVFIFIVIIGALLSFVLGTPVEASDITQPVIDFERVGFWAVFAVFFPAVTGIEAGISMSGDLEKPHKALPFGTLAAVLVGYICYIGFAYKFSISATPEVLVANRLLMIEVAVIGFLIYLGIWGATLSSTMGALLGAPRTMQALAKDRILPSFLAKGKDDNNEPQRATLASFFIAALGLFIGELNAIASLLTMFFLTSYGALNLVSGLEGLLANPSWRPTFRTPWILSMAGAFLCFGAMFMIDSGFSFVAFGLIISVYYFMRRRRLRTHYSDIRSGLTLRFAREFIYKFDSIKIDERNWRPNFLVVCGSPKKRLYLIDLAYQMTLGRGFITVASILFEKEKSLDLDRITSLQDSTKEFLNKREITVLTKVVPASDFNTGFKYLIRSYGIGRVTPNTVMLGNSDTKENYPNFIQAIKDAVDNKKNLVIVKTETGFDESQVVRGQSIDVWWRGREGNLGFMLTMAYMLRMSKQWQVAKLTLKTVVETEEQRDKVLRSIKSFIQSSRIRLDYKIFVESEKDPYDVIKKESMKTDLVFVGLQPPSEELDYLKYYQDLMEKTKELPHLVFTLKSDDIDFSKIFR